MLVQVVCTRLQGLCTLQERDMKGGRGLVGARLLCLLLGTLVPEEYFALFLSQVAWLRLFDFVTAPVYACIVCALSFGVYVSVVCMCACVRVCVCVMVCCVLFQYIVLLYA
jgi:hypothetical protein